MKKYLFLKDGAKDPCCTSLQFFRLFSHRRSSVFLACCLLSFYSSCKKGDSGSGWQIPMIKTETTNNLTVTYSYDKKGRIVKLENSGILLTEFTYTADSIYYKTTELSTSVVEKNAGKLNANGRVLSLSGTEYKYDASGRLSEVLYPPLSNGWQTRNNYFYNSATGLLDSMRQTEGRLLQTRWLQTTIYTYFTTLDETHGNENKGMAYLGKNDLHPVKHSETWSPIAAAPFRKISYTTDRHYGYDDAGRIVVQDHTETRPDNTTVQWRTVYTYY